MAKNIPAARKGLGNALDAAQEDDMSGEAAGAPDVDGLKFEAALAELEQLVRGMEDGRLPLEESIAAYRRGSALLGHCQRLLQEAEQKIQILENGALRDFDARGEAQ